MNKLEDGEQALNKAIARERILDVALKVCCWVSQLLRSQDRGGESRDSQGKLDSEEENKESEKKWWQQHSFM